MPEELWRVQDRALLRRRREIESEGKLKAKESRRDREMERWRDGEMEKKGRRGGRREGRKEGRGAKGELMSPGG